MSYTTPLPYRLRAWLTFDGTGTPSIYESSNILSIADGGVGIYTITFINPMPDVNYGILGTAGNQSAAAARALGAHSRTTSSCVINTFIGTAFTDITFSSVAIVR